MYNEVDQTLVVVVVGQEIHNNDDHQNSENEQDKRRAIWHVCRETKNGEDNNQDIILENENGKMTNFRCKSWSPWQASRMRSFPFE